MSSNDTTSSDTSSDLNVSLGITAGYSLGYFLAFVLLRTKFKVFYAPKQEAEFPLAPKELSNGRFKWLFELWKTTDDDIFNMAGLDALMYLRFLRLCFTLFLVFIPFGIFVLLPLNITGDGGATGFDVYTMTNIKENAPRLWAHLIGVYCFTLATLYLLTREYKQFITIRQRYLLQSHVHHYSILVREIPPQYRTDEKLKEFFNEVFPGKVVGAYIARKLSNLSKKVKKHENYVKKYEHALAVQEQDEKHERPMRRKYLGCCGKKEDVIAKMEFKCNKYSNLIQKKQAKKHKLDPNGFVTFSSKFDAAVAAQGLMIRDPQSFITEPAVEPRDVFWFGMSLKTKERDVRQLIAYGLMFGLTFFWTIPITFISSLTTLSALSEELPWLDFINDLPESIVSFVQGFLPALILNIFLMIVPILIRIICVVSGVYAKSQISKMTLTRYFFFQVVNVFLVFTLSGAVLNQISDIINDPLSIATLLANSIPKQSLFFINFIMVDGIIGSYGDLFRLVPLVIWNIKMKLAKTPKEKEDASEPDGFEYDENYPKQLILLLVVLVFSTISPLIILFGVAAFGSSFLVNKYNLIYVCDKEFETGGSFWPVVFNRIATCVTISQITMAGYFSIMKAPGPAAAMVPLIIATFLYYSTATERYSFPAQNVPLRLAKKETLDTDPDRDTVLKTANATFDVMMKAGGSMVKAGGSVVKVGGDVVRAGGSVVALLTKGATFTKPMRKIALENQKSEFTMGDGENEDVESDVNNNNNNNNYNNNNNNDNDNKESNDNNDNSGPNESNNNNTQEESLPNKPKTLFSFGRHNKQTDVEEGANLRKTLLKSKLETNDKKEAVVEIPDEGSSSNNNNNDDGKVEETSESVAANNSGASSSRGTKVTSCHEHNVANCPHDMCRKLTAHDLKFAYLQSELRCDVSDPFKHVIDVKPAPAVRKGASIIGIAGLENEEEEEERKKNENENENENNNKGKENKGKNPTSSSTTENKESDSDNDKPTNTKLTNSVSKLSFQRQASRFSQLADEEDVEKGKEVKPVLRPMVVDDSSDSDSSDSDDDDDDDVDRDAKRMKHIDVDDRPESDEKEKQKRAARNNAADGGASSPSFLQKVAKFFGFDSASSSHQEPQQYQQQQLPQQQQQQQQHYHEDQDQDHENVSLKSMSRK